MVKRASCVLAIVSSICFLSYSQSQTTGPTGTWRVERPGSSSLWKAVFKAYGRDLIGAVSVSENSAAEISQGRIDGTTITFKYTGGRRTINLTGTINGDEIAFVWEAEDQNGNPPDPTDPMFGSAAPRRFMARRAPATQDVVTQMAERVRKPPAVTFDRIVRADQEPENWLTYSGTLSGRRHSPLRQITPENVKNLELAWLWQSQASGLFEATSLVVDGVLYTIQNPNDVVALDAATGRVLWKYAYTPSRYNGRRLSRGLAILGDTLFMGTVDAQLLAIKAYSGELVWKASVANAADPSCGGGECYSINHAPLVAKNKVLVGPAGAEGLIRGFIAAFDATTGKEMWRFHTIPGPGEAGHETWSGDSWKTGGGSVWNTGSYDPDLNLTYWGIGNPSPYDAAARPGDNLYSESVVALDADTGELRWHYQFTPHDEADWDSTQVPVLADMHWQGRSREVMIFANRNGLMYVLDRATGEFLMAKPFVEVNWMSGFDEKGRPVRTARSSNTAIKPGLGELGATNWYPPSYSPETQLLYVPAWEATASPRYSAIRALDPRTGEKKWEFKRAGAIFKAGALTTASNLLFTGTLGQFAEGRVVDGLFSALDARTGQLLWERSLPGSIQSGLISYEVAGRQYVAVAAGNTLFSYALKR